MSVPIPYKAVLACHPETATSAVQAIEAAVYWTEDEALALTYVVKGDLAGLRIPAPGPPRRGQGLWRHTCFEAFVSVKDKAEYYEFNFAPSGEWAVYAFRSYRDGAELNDEELTPAITVRRPSDFFGLDAIVRLPRALKIDARSTLRLGISAVVEHNDGRLSYWALKHPPGKPDFHHADAFGLELSPPDVKAMAQSLVSKR